MPQPKIKMIKVKMILSLFILTSKRDRHLQNLYVMFVDAHILV